MDNERIASWKRALLRRAVAVVAPALFGVVGVYVTAIYFRHYGLTLFIGLPLVVSFFSALIWCFKRERPMGNTFGVACQSLLVLGALILLLAFDGLICLLMSLPLTLLLAWLGTGLGRWTGASLGDKARRSVGVWVACLFPLFVGFEQVVKPEASVREVTTSVLIDASMEEVWERVIAFPKITEPPKGLFQWGIAYPVEARIEGVGVGAIRYCIFSTGCFVEPITRWDAPYRLSFDVAESPPPMREISFYKELHSPHLHGHMASKKGEFRLSKRDGKVWLEGTTWYTHELFPQFYWGAISDQIIHMIHQRVLHHIKAHAERAAATASTGGDAAMLTPRWQSPRGGR